MSETESAAPPRETIASVMASRARQTSDAMLVTDVAVGVIVAALVFVFLPSWWRFALADVALACFGAWGILDRSRGDEADKANASRDRRIAVASKIVATLGFAAGALCAITIFVMLMGYWRS
jgi:hypothetical protein